jgi:predicted dehydrogenase
MSTTRWGIISTGKIARTFADALKQTEGAELVAVGSRSQESADRFGDEFNIPHCYDTYEGVAADHDVDVVYIGTPHPLHKDNTLMCLESGKAVLCEKPFAMNADDAAEMIWVAREQRLFLMEAMWTRFLPLFVKLRKMLQDQVLGDIHYLNADFGFRAPFDPKHRLFAPELGGSALLDVGIYPVSLASMVFGAPDRIDTVARLGETGVDEQSSMMFRYLGGKMAALFSSTRLKTPCEATIAGENGFVRIHSRWHQSEAMTLQLDGKEAEFISAPHGGNPYRFEAMEVMRCMKDGMLESPVMKLDESLVIMRTMDIIQEMWKGY